MSTFSIMGPHNTDLPDPFDIFPIDDTAVCFILQVVKRSLKAQKRSRHFS